MIPVAQTEFYVSYQNQGNSFSAALASVLHLSLEDIPKFTSTTTWKAELNTWLKPYGYVYIEVSRYTFDSMSMKDVICILHGSAEKQTTVYDHYCVGKGVDVIMHDPHPEKIGLRTVNMVGVLVDTVPSISRIPAGVAALDEKEGEGSAWERLPPMVVIEGVTVPGDV